MRLCQALFPPIFPKYTIKYWPLALGLELGTVSQPSISLLPSLKPSSNSTTGLVPNDMASKKRSTHRRRGQKKAGNEVSPVTVPARFPLLELPREILDVILENISPVGEIFLGLTCRGLKKLIFPNGFSYQYGLNRMICLRLERDLPCSFYCYYCDKLHKWETGPFLGPVEYQCKSRTNLLFICELGNYRLTYLQTRQLMDYARSGRAYDIQLKRIEGTYEYDASSGIRHTQQWQAKIIEDELHLKTTYIFSHADGNDTALWQKIITTGPRVCRHDSSSRPDLIPSIRRRVRMVEREPGDARRIDCYGCCAIDVEWPRLSMQEPTAPIEFIVYQNLGRCRDPSDRAEIRVTWTESTSGYSFERELFRDAWLDDEAEKELAVKKEASIEMARKSKALKQKVRNKRNRKRRYRERRK